MPAFHTQIGVVTNHVWAYIRKLAAEESGDDGSYLLKNADVAADWTGNGVTVRLYFDRTEVWVKTLPIDEIMLSNTLKISEMEPLISKAMRGSLSLVGSQHMVRLDILFPQAIQKVDVEYNAERDCKMIAVTFKNGHVAVADEKEARTDLFTARCAMLYDLPPV